MILVLCNMLTKGLLNCSEMSIMFSNVLIMIIHTISETFKQ